MCWLVFKTNSLYWYHNIQDSLLRTLWQWVFSISYAPIHVNNYCALDVLCLFTLASAFLGHGDSQHYFMPFSRSWHSHGEELQHFLWKDKANVPWPTRLDWVSDDNCQRESSLSRTQSAQHSPSGHLGLAWFLSYYSKMGVELLPNFLVCALILLRIVAAWILKMSLNTILQFMILTLLTTF